MAISRAHLLVPVNVAGPLPAVGVLAVGDVVVGHPAPAAALVPTLHTRQHCNIHCKGGIWPSNFKQVQWTKETVASIASIIMHDGKW